MRVYMARRLYGLSPEQLRSLGWTCRICGALSSGKRGLHIDHDHTTNTVRGLLCGRCNTAIGSFNDSPSLLRRAARYLESVGVVEDAPDHLSEYFEVVAGAYP